MNATATSTYPTGASAVADKRSGILAGLAAGLAMSVVMMAITTFVMAMGPWAAPKMAWSLVAGKDAIRPGFELVPVLGGSLIHLALSAAYGLIFAWLSPHVAMRPALLGALYGFLIYVVNIVAMPAIAPGWVGHMAPPDAAMHALQAAEHVVFGVVLGAFYGAWRRDTRAQR